MTVIKHKERSMLWRVTVITGGVILAIAGLLFAGAIILNNINKENERKVSEVGLSFAREQCLVSGRTNEICQNLKVDVEPPPDWGIHSYLVYVYNPAVEKFDSTMAIEFENGQPKVIDFGITEFEDYPHSSKNATPNS